jgi:hypothetical protein
MENQETKPLSSRAERQKLAETISQLDSRADAARQKHFKGLFERAKKLLTDMRGGEEHLRYKAEKRENQKKLKDLEAERSARAKELKAERRERDAESREYAQMHREAEVENEARDAAAERARIKEERREKGKKWREDQINFYAQDLEKNRSSYGKTVQTLREGMNVMRLRMAEEKVRINSEKAAQLRKKLEGLKVVAPEPETANPAPVVEEERMAA